MSDNYNKELIKDPLFRDIICSSKNCFMHLDYEFTTNEELWTSKIVRIYFRSISRRSRAQTFSIFQSKNDRVQNKISKQIKAASECMKINDVLLAGFRKKENQKMQLQIDLISSFTGYYTIRGNSNFYKCKGWIQTLFLWILKSLNFRISTISLDFCRIKFESD